MDEEYNAGNNKRLWLLFATYFGICFYLFLCLLNLFSQRPLWLDEKFIFDNLKELPPAQLFGPLKHSQAFPRLYLFLIQKLAFIFDFNLISLRILPFLFMIGAFFVWLKIFAKSEGKGLAYFLFILAWCGSYPLTYYSAELKQYSADILVAAVFTYFILSQRKYLKEKNANLFVALKYLFIPALILFSYTGFFFILIPAYNLLLSLKRNKNSISYLVIYVSSALLFFFISYNFDVKYVLSESGLRNYWNDYFISVTTPYEFMKTFTEGLRNLFTRWFLEKKIVIRIITIFSPFAFFGLVILGCKKLLQDKGRVLTLFSLGLVLFLSLFTAGILRMYPFTGARVTLFIAIFIFYAIIKSIEIFKKPLFFFYLILLSIYMITLSTTSFYFLVKYLNKIQ